MKIFSFLLLALVLFNSNTLNASNNQASITLHASKNALKSGESFTISFIIEAVEDLKGLQLDMIESSSYEFKDSSDPFNTESHVFSDVLHNEYDKKMGTLLLLDQETVTIDEETLIFTVELEALSSMSELRDAFIISDDIDHITYGDAVIALKLSDAFGEAIDYEINWTFQREPKAFELLGDESIQLEVFDNYKEKGAVYNEHYDLIIEGNVDTNTLGEYTLDYYLEDDDQTFFQASRTIMVIDETPPVVALNKGIDTIYVGEAWEDASVNYNDNYDDNPMLTTSGTVDSTKAGSYQITYKVEDQSGNTTAVQRMVHVTDEPADVEFRLGTTLTTLWVGMEFEDDHCFIDINDESFMCEVLESTIDYTTQGEYEIIYGYTYQGVQYKTVRKVFYIEPSEHFSQVINYYMPLKRQEEWL